MSQHSGRPTGALAACFLALSLFFLASPFHVCEWVWRGQRSPITLRSQKVNVLEFSAFMGRWKAAVSEGNSSMISSYLPKGAGLFPSASSPITIIPVRATAEGERFPQRPTAALDSSTESTGHADGAVEGCSSNGVPGRDFDQCQDPNKTSALSTAREETTTAAPTLAIERLGSANWEEMVVRAEAGVVWGVLFVEPRCKDCEEIRSLFVDFANAFEDLSSYLTRALAGPEGSEPPARARFGLVSCTEGSADARLCQELGVPFSFPRVHAFRGWKNLGSFDHYVVTLQSLTNWMQRKLHPPVWIISKAEQVELLQHVPYNGFVLCPPPSIEDEMASSTSGECMKPHSAGGGCQMLPNWYKSVAERHSSSLFFAAVTSQDLCWKMTSATWSDLEGERVTRVVPRNEREHRQDTIVVAAVVRPPKEALEARGLPGNSISAIVSKLWSEKDMQPLDFEASLHAGDEGSGNNGEGGKTEEDFEAFVRFAQFPIISGVTGQNFFDLRTAGYRLVLLVLDPLHFMSESYASRFCETAAWWHQKRQFLFGIVDGREYEYALEGYGIFLDDLPRVIVFDSAPRMFYEDHSLSIGSLDEGLWKILAGEVPLQPEEGTFMSQLWRKIRRESRDVYRYAMQSVFNFVKVIAVAFVCVFFLIFLISLLVQVLCPAGEHPTDDSDGEDSDKGTDGEASEGEEEGETDSTSSLEPSDDEKVASPNNQSDAAHRVPELDAPTGVGKDTTSQVAEQGNGMESGSAAEKPGK